MIDWNRPLMVKGEREKTYRACLSNSNAARQEREIKYLSVEMPSGFKMIPFHASGKSVDSELRVINRNLTIGGCHE